MKNILSPKLEELPLMSSKEKDKLIVCIFEWLENLQDRLEKIEKNQQNSAHSKQEESDRRKFERMKVPIVNSNFCEVMLPKPKEDSSLEYKQNYELAINKLKHNHNYFGYCATAINLICFRLYDVSAAGCSLLNHDEEFSYFLMPHRIYEDCRIIIPNKEDLIVSIEIVSKRNIECYDAHKFNELVGIRFIAIQRHHVNDSNKAKIPLRDNHILSTTSYEIINEVK